MRRRSRRLHGPASSPDGPFAEWGAIDPVLLANIRWLAGYRHPRNHREPAASELAAAFAEPGALLAGAERVGDRLAVLPVLYHLLWRRSLEVDLESGMLGPRSMVRRAVKARSRRPHSTLDRRLRPQMGLYRAVLAERRRPRYVDSAQAPTVSSTAHNRSNSPMSHTVSPAARIAAIRVRACSMSMKQSLLIGFCRNAPGAEAT